MKQAGQVVLFRFPQTDLAEGKLRPALLLGKLPGELGAIGQNRSRKTSTHQATPGRLADDSVRPEQYMRMGPTRFASGRCPALGHWPFEIST